MSKLHPRLTYANVVSSLALFLAVSGGTAFAAAQIGTRDIKRGAVTTSRIDRNAVTSSRIRPSTIRSSDIRRNTIRSSDIRRSTIRSSDIRNGTLQASDFAEGQLPAGPRGPAGPQGPPGPPGGGASSLNGVVSAPGTLVYGSGVAAVSVAGSGVYTVTFSQNVSQCPATATIGGYQLGGNTESGTDGGTVSLQPGGNNNPTAATQITFVTRNLAGVNTPLPFHFAVFC